MNDDGLAITIVTFPAFAVSFVVLKASALGDADRWSVVAPPLAAAPPDDAVEVEAGVLVDDELEAVVLLLLELPHPATRSTTPRRISIETLRTARLLSDYSGSKDSGRRNSFPQAL
jgi:hypothetical protein